MNEDQIERPIYGTVFERLCIFMVCSVFVQSMTESWTDILDVKPTRSCPVRSRTLIAIETKHVIGIEILALDAITRYLSILQK